MENKDKIMENKDMEKGKEYKPMIVRLPKVLKDDMMVYDEEPEFSINTDYPCFSLGFQHYIHANKNKLDILQQFNNKKKIFRVINEFEVNVDNYTEAIANNAIDYFGLKGEGQKIASRGFYKLWEIVMAFDLIDDGMDNFVSMHMGESMGSFIQATMMYREKFGKNVKNDKYYSYILPSEDTENNVITIGKDVIKNLESRKGFSTINKGMKDKANFITANGGLSKENDNMQEQKSFRLVLSEIYYSVSNQKKGGHMVCKIFETYTLFSIKMILLLSSFYDEVYIYKPLTSRASNSEKYIICKNFKYGDTDKEYMNKLKKVSNIYNGLKKLNESGVYIVDMFKKYVLSDEIIKYMIYVNVHLSNKQFQNINEIVEFIKSQNYYGEVYQNKRDEQINANTYWIKKYFVSKTDYNNAIKKNADELVKGIINISK